MVIAVINVDAHPFLAFSDLICHLGDTGLFFLVALCWLLVRRPKLEVASKKLLCQQVNVLR